MNIHPASRISAVILAAGRSTRMTASSANTSSGTRNKLLLPLRGIPILQHTLNTVSSLPFAEILVVTGGERATTELLSIPYRIKKVYNPDYINGMATSIRAGVKAAAKSSEGLLIVLADMPLVKPTTLTALCERFAEHLSSNTIIIPTSGGKRGNPILFHVAFKPELMRLDGDMGAKSLIANYDDAVQLVEVSDEGILEDIDTPDTYQKIRERLQL